MKNQGRSNVVLQVSTPSDREIVLTRVFEAPRNLVFDALTKAELLKRWFGSRSMTMVVCEVDLRVGGTWCYKWRGSHGTEWGMRGVYREIVPPERLVYTAAFDNFSGEALGTTVLIEKRGRTTMIATTLYPSPEIRDAVIRSGMEHGAAESYDRLAELLASGA